MDIIYVHMLFWVDSTHRFSVGRQNTTFLFYFPSHLTFDSSVSVNLYKILIRQFQIKVTVDLSHPSGARAFVRVSLSSVVLLTGTHLGVPFRLNFALPA